MKATTFILLSGFSAVTWASPEAKPLPEPQWQGSGIGQLVLGPIDQRRNNGYCRCQGRPQRCYGTSCECSNQAAIDCWVSQKGGCSVQLQNCPGARGYSPPTSPSSAYPPCGLNFNYCGYPRQCRRVDLRCQGDQRQCLGICVPDLNVTPSQQQQPPPWVSQQPPLGQTQWPNEIPPLQSNPIPQPIQWPNEPAWSWQANPTALQQPRPAPQPHNTGLCPVDFQCEQEYICVMDPRDPVTPICIRPTRSCGDRYGACGPLEDCVLDPRYSCRGQGCPGVCA